MMYALLVAVRHNFVLVTSGLLLVSGLYYAFLPTFWAIPTMILCESAAAATLGLINSIGQLGGFVGPYFIGFLNDRTHTLTASFCFIALVYVAAASLIFNIRIRDPIESSQSALEVPEHVESNA
jgi:nitrate/nitrite transporter NarK